MVESTHEATPIESQVWVARAIAIENELAARNRELKAALDQSENLHFEDLINFSAGKSAATATSPEASLDTFPSALKGLGNQSSLLHQRVQDSIQLIETCCQRLCSALPSDQVSQDIARKLVQGNSAKYSAKESESAIEPMDPVRNRPTPSPGLPNSSASIADAGSLYLNALDTLSQLSIRRERMAADRAKLHSLLTEMRGKVASIRSEVSRLKTRVKNS